MRNIWFLSDHHFDHANMLKFKDDAGNPIRPFSSVEEMNEAMIERHNSVVRAGDIFYDCGDVTFKPGLYWKIGPRLNGKKRLLLGNHDDGRNFDLLKHFEKVGIWRLFKEQNIVFSHIPLRLDQFRQKVQFCGHGHIHQNMIDDPRYINLCVEHNDYTPVHMDQLIETMKARRESVEAVIEKELLK